MRAAGSFSRNLRIQKAKRGGPRIRILKTISICFGLNVLFSGFAWGDIRGLVKKETGQRLRAAPGVSTAEVQDAILRESRKNHLDPLLVVAVIEHESAFSPHKRGRHGEIGLMQIKPATGAWIARNREIAWKPEGLDDPSFNIAIGTAYLGMLKNRFHERRLYLAAYNMGPSRMKSLIRKREVPRRYSRQVLRRYRRLYASRD